MSRNVGVDQDVLEAFWLREPQCTHPVARPAAADRQRRPDEVGVEVTDLVAGFEARRVAIAGFDGKARRWRRSSLVGRGWRVAAAQTLDFEKAGVRHEPADDASLERGGQLRKRRAVGR